MIDPFYDFEWPVAHAYVWQDWLDNRGKPVVVPSRGFRSFETELAVEFAWNHREQGKAPKSGPVLAPVVNPGEPIRRYRPMDRQHATLFQEFGALDFKNPQAIAAFAGSYGLMGVRSIAQTLALRSDNGPRSHYAAGEPLLDWALEICHMREGLYLSGIQRSSRDEHRLSWLFNRNLQRVQGRISLEGPKGPMLQLQPLDLLAAIWLQFSLAVSGDKRFVACKFCHRTFEISTDLSGFRSHREFCSASCKTLDYRKRKREALELARAGETVEQISDRIATNTATIRRWITTGQREARSRRKGRN